MMNTETFIKVVHNTAIRLHGLAGVDCSHSEGGYFVVGRTPQECERKIAHLIKTRGVRL